MLQFFLFIHFLVQILQSIVFHTPTHPLALPHYVYKRAKYIKYSIDDECSKNKLLLKMENGSLFSVIFVFVYTEAKDRGVGYN